MEDIIRMEVEHFQKELEAIQNCLLIAEKNPEDREISLKNAQEYVAELLTYSRM